MKTYTDIEIAQQCTGALQHWHYRSGFLCRSYQTAGWKGTLMVVNTIGHLAEAAWHHPDLEVSYSKVVVKLQTHEARGISDRDLELAREIERVVQWQPATAGGALEGTPSQDERYAYVKYDE